MAIRFTVTPATVRQAAVRIFRCYGCSNVVPEEPDKSTVAYFDPARTFRPNPNFSHFRATSSTLSARQRNCAASSIERPDSIAALRSSISISGTSCAVVNVHHKSSRIPLKNGCRTLPLADLPRYSISADSEARPRCRDARFSCAGPALAGLTKPPRRRMPGHRRR